MYYYYQHNIFVELRRDAMTYYAGTVQKHIETHEEIGAFKNTLPHDPRFEILLLNHKKKILFASADSFDFPFYPGFFEYRNRYFLITPIEFRQLKKVRYLVIRADSIEPQLEQTRKSIYIFLVFSILFLSAVVTMLGKLFLHPVRDTIQQLDRFIRDTTHELNTPLSVITMSIEQLNSADLSPKHTKHVNRISVASRTISNLYNDLTFLLMHERTRYNDYELDIQALLMERIEYFTPIADAKKITIHTDLNPSVYRINREPMTRLIDNLLSNAIKYNVPSGEIRIRLDEHSLSVRDSGIGIPKEALDEIFRRYTRFDEANGGFGIGLNIIQMICQKYQMKIHVVSDLGIGSEFSVSWDQSSH